MVGTAVSLLVLVLVLVVGGEGMSVLEWPSLTCGEQQGLMCKVNTTISSESAPDRLHGLITVPDGVKLCVCVSNCMDIGWLTSNTYTPSAPEQLQVSLGWRTVGGGEVPVVNASWMIRDDGSVQSLNATELQVLVVSTNQNVCVRYVFLEKLGMRNLLLEQWLFSASMLEVTPGQTYKISVSNIPKPEQGHSSYDVSVKLRVPGCHDDSMRKAQYCIERGSLWKPNITVGQRSSSSSSSSSPSLLTVSFLPDRLCVNYNVIATGCSIQQVQKVAKTEQATLDVALSMDRWPRTCCRFTVVVQPLFPRCRNDCPRANRTLDLCGGPEPFNWTVFLVLGVLLLVLVLGAPSVFYVCRTKRKHFAPPPPPGGGIETGPGIIQPLHQGAPKVLVIYSQDHSLYRDVVLKLVTFLQSRCGTQVLVDLLDSASLGQVGRIRWLELQRRQLAGPSDKILVLCSRGLQAKWRALCSRGGLGVTLREDLLSPTDDLCIPFLNLFVPDLHRAGMLGKYLVCYFEDFGTERDVPSLFDVAVKYRLMTQFEDLYLRILDVEKFQPGRQLHVEGLGVHEYFQCPSGRALQHAIWTFRDYQLKNPDWFERECVDGGEEFLKEAWRSSTDLEQVLPILQRVPLIRTGPPALVQEVEVKECGSSGGVLVKNIRPWCPSHLNGLSEDHRDPNSENVRVVEPLLRISRMRDWFPSAGYTEEVEEVEEVEQVEEVEELEEEEQQEHQVLLLSDHAKQSVSDQGYGSRMPSPCEAPLKEDLLEDHHLQDHHLEEHVPLENYHLVDHLLEEQSLEDYPLKEDPLENYPSDEDPLEALRRLQEELLRTNLRYFDPDG
ncbi:interleukin 17 receptor A1a isoform X2 [Nelusetta ayraudi]|uniref:interleukin 17 receptor A1a isoform X2 n=1 Tax=Nelusetta ayraudi TaxID=303726 RepID=UPI003F707828